MVTFFIRVLVYTHGYINARTGTNGEEFLPEGVEAAELDTTTVLDRTPVAALFVAGGGDRIAPVIDVRKLFGRAAPGSEMVVVAGASHEAVPYHFDELLPSVLAWLNERNGSLRAEVGNRQPH